MKNRHGRHRHAVARVAAAAAAATATAVAAAAGDGVLRRGRRRRGHWRPDAETTGAAAGREGRAALHCGRNSGGAVHTVQYSVWSLCVAGLMAPT